MTKTSGEKKKVYKHKSEIDKARILQCCLNKVPWKIIRRDFNTTDGTIGRILKKHKTSGVITRKPGSGRKRITSATEDRAIILEVKRNPFVSSIEIAKNFSTSVSVSTIRRRIKEGGEFKSYWASRKPYISDRNIQRRLDWCLAHQNWSIDQWRRVIFSDESPFVLRYNRKKRVWRRHNERYNLMNCVATVKHDIKIMVWGCFAAHGVGSFYRVSGRMEQVQYGQILTNYALPSCEKLFGGPSHCIWQQDNDPKHTARSNVSLLERLEFTKLDWPAQSPDLSPIENLWSILDHNLSKRVPNNANDLFDILHKEWNALPIDLLDQLVCSMPARIRACIAAKGGMTKY